MWPPKKKSNIEKIAKAYSKGTKSVKTAVKHSGVYGQDPAMDQRAKATGITLKQGDTYSFTGTESKRVPKGKGKAMGMTYGSGDGTKYIKKKRAK